MSDKKNEKDSSTDSKQNADSGKLDEKVPMELAAGSPGQPPKKGFFKRLFMRIGEKVGTVAKSELSPEYLAAVKELEEFYAVTKLICEECCRVAQENPDFRAQDMRMNVQAPKGKDPYEMLADYLKGSVKEMGKPELMEKLQKVSRRLGSEHRNMQGRVRRAIHDMRTFINVHYPQMQEEREKVLSLRSEMDYARHEYTNDPVEVKKLGFEQAEQALNRQVQLVLASIRGLDAKKDQYQLNLLAVLKELHDYHLECYKECSRLKKDRKELGVASIEEDPT